MKSFLTISILVIFSIVQVGYGVLFFCSIQQAKEDMKIRIFSSLKDSELDVISYTENQDKIVWEEEGKEFSLNGEMYDVVRCKSINNKKIIYCVSDKNETSLLKKYSKIIEENSPNGKKQKSVNFEQFIFYFDGVRQPEKPLYFTLKRAAFSSYNSTILIGFKNTVLQPPRQVLFSI